MAFLNWIFGNIPTYKKDIKCGGYIAYYKDHKGIVGQGNTKKEALANLEEDLKLVIKLKDNKDHKSEYTNTKHSIAHS